MLTLILLYHTLRSDYPARSRSLTPLSTLMCSVCTAAQYRTVIDALTSDRLRDSVTGSWQVCARLRSYQPEAGDHMPPDRRHRWSPSGEAPAR